MDPLHSNTTVAKTVPAADLTTGYVTEMFCSVQGEGLYAGERQLFLRTSGCSATCYWCDTASSKRERRACLIHGAGKRSLDNPMQAVDAVREALALCASEGPIRTISITGGEPLEQPQFVHAVATGLRAAGLRIHLETSGIESKALLQVRDVCDIFAVDVKLPYATGIDHWGAHRDFLQALQGRDVFVKVVVDTPAPMAEIEQAVQLVADIDASMPFILQPESSTYLKNRRGVEGRQQLDDMLEHGSRYAMHRLTDVRVIPQLHKVMKIR